MRHLQAGLVDTRHRRRAGGRGRACGGRRPGRPASVRTRPRSRAAARAAGAGAATSRARPRRSGIAAGRSPGRRLGLAQRRNARRARRRVSPQGARRAARRVRSRSPRLEPSPHTPARWMIALAGMLLLLSRRRAGLGTFSLVEVRPGREPFLRLTGAQELSPTHRPLARARALSVAARDAGLVRAAEPERRIARARRESIRCSQASGGSARSGRRASSAPGPGVPVAVVDTGLDLRRIRSSRNEPTPLAEHAERRRQPERLPRHRGRVGRRRAGQRRRDGRHLSAGVRSMRTTSTFGGDQNARR